MIGRIVRLIDHIRKGTLVDRIHGEWRERTKKRRQIRWNTRNGKREYVETRIEHGLRMRLHFDSELARLIYCDEFEKSERRFVSAFLRAGDVFVDVGANIGLFSLIAARHVRRPGAVYAFEPAQTTFRRLKDNVKLNGLHNVHCFHSALSDEIGDFPFYTSNDGFDAWNSFSPPFAGKSFSSEFIQAVTWDHFARCHELVGKVTMMKIDVEGWESKVLQGGLETFSRKDAPLLQIEFTDEASVSAGSSCERLYRILEELGYTMFIYDHPKRDLVPDPLRVQYPYVNMIATKDPDKARARIHRQSLFRTF